MFVRSADGKHYPIASVEHLSTGDDGSDRAKLKEGGTVELASGELNRLLLHSGQPFPAAPDTYVLEQIDERCRTSSYARVPVLAWMLCHGRGVLPVTTEGINHGLDRTVPVLMPSGEVVVAGECTYADEDCYLDELKSSRAT
ncbi:MAG TPA: hypothetical protein VF098_03365 [Sphingomicrobium sp.]|jgi:hypothetical protein